MLIDGFCGGTHFHSQLCAKKIKNNKFVNVPSKVGTYHSYTSSQVAADTIKEKGYSCMLWWWMLFSGHSAD